MANSTLAVRLIFLAAKLQPATGLDFGVKIIGVKWGDRPFGSDAASDAALCTVTKGLAA